MLTLESMRQYKDARGVHRERRDRDRAQRGADAGADAPRRLRQVVGHRAGRAPDAAAGQGQGPVHQRAADHRRLLHPRRRRRRLAPRRDDHARARPGGGHEGLGQHRGARDRRRARPSNARQNDQGRLRRRHHRDRLRRLEPAHRPDGRRLDPADADGPPDDRHRPRAAVREHDRDDRVPDRPRRRHEHVRAPGGHRPRDRLLRPPPDHARRRRHPESSKSRRSARPSCRSPRRTSTRRWRSRSS